MIREYSTSSSKRKLLKVNSADQVNYITMNLTQPPFDDIARASGDELGHRPSGLRKAWGGPVAGPVADHIMPDSMLNGELSDFTPFKTPG